MKSYLTPAQLQQHYEDPISSAQELYSVFHEALLREHPELLKTPQNRKRRPLEQCKWRVRNHLQLQIYFLNIFNKRTLSISVND